MSEYINVGADVHDKTILVKMARGLARISQCAVKGVDLQWVRFPPGKGSLQPVAIGATEEVTNRLKPSV